MWAWGFHHHGQLGDGTNVSTNTPIKIMDNVCAVSTGVNISVPSIPPVAPPTGDSGILFALVFLMVSAAASVLKLFNQTGKSLKIFLIVNKL
jgi:hypothetical protein